KGNEDRQQQTGAGRDASHAVPSVRAEQSSARARRGQAAQRLHNSKMEGIAVHSAFDRHLAQPMTCSPAAGPSLAPTGAVHGETQMSKLESFLAQACMLALLVCSGCGANDRVAPASSAPAKQVNRSTNAKPNAAQQETAATKPGDLPPAAQRGTLLQRLP